MPRASFVLGIIASAMVHIFFGNRRHEQTDSVTEDVVDAESGAYTQPHAHEESSAFENWLCDICDFDNRALRSTSARKSARTCSNCGNDFIYKISPRKHAHKALIEARPVQIRAPYRVGNDVLSSQFSVRLNEHTLPGSFLYKRFVDLVKHAKPGEIVLAFHGTSASAAKSILMNGMCPSRRINTQGDWFTLDVNYALTRSICREDHSAQWGIAGPNAPNDDRDLPKHVVVICFAVYMPKTVYIGEHIVCTCHKHSLPISSLEFPRE